jgi:hypothetical protein
MLAQSSAIISEGKIPQILAVVKKEAIFQLLFDWSQQDGSVYIYWLGHPMHYL